MRSSPCNFVFVVCIGVQNVPHVESTDSEQSYRDSESDTCESDEDGEEEINNDVQRVYPLLQKLKVEADSCC